MLGCTYGTVFRTSVAGGTYEEGLTVVLQGVPPDVALSEALLHRSMLLGDSTTRTLREPDIPIIYSGVNPAHTMPDVANRGRTNGTPLVILIPNLTRHLERFAGNDEPQDAVQPNGHTPHEVPTTCDWHDAQGASLFTARHTSAILAAGAVANRVLQGYGIEVFAYIKELGGEKAPDMSTRAIHKGVDGFRYKQRLYDPVHAWAFSENHIKDNMPFIEKVKALGELKNHLTTLRSQYCELSEETCLEDFGVHPIVNCPDFDTAVRMYQRACDVYETGDSCGGVIEVIATGMPAGVGEPFFNKLDGELARMMAIDVVRAVEIGAGTAVKDMMGTSYRDEMRIRDGHVRFATNHSGGIANGVTTGQPVCVRLTVGPSPVRKKAGREPLEDEELDAVSCGDAASALHLWPVAEAFTAIVLLDQLMAYRKLSR